MYLALELRLGRYLLFEGLVNLVSEFFGVYWIGLCLVVCYQCLADLAFELCMCYCHASELEYW